ncbi:hypothetical protein [Vibrio neptunius]|nr:hypothetical protein [Vibrio neptunius]
MEHFVSGMDFILRDFGTGYALWNALLRESGTDFAVLEKNDAICRHSLD